MDNLTPAQFKRLREQLTGFFWDTGFDDFCQVTEMNLNDTYAEQKWEAFTTCIRMMQNVPDEMWEALLVKVQQTAPSANKGGR